MKQWYTLYTKPQAEHQVAAFLEHRGFEIFLPKLKTKSDNRRDKALFPRYLFLRIDVNLIDYSELQWTPGLIRLVSVDHHPLPIQDCVIGLLQKHSTMISSSDIQSNHNFQPGDEVRITTGPFAEMLAIFEGPTTPSQRVQILLNVLGGSRVKVQAEHLVRADHLAKTETKVEAPIIPKRPRRTRGRGRKIKQHNTVNHATSLATHH